MNIFVLDYNPEIAATYQKDKHVIKMILETAQLLCSVSWKYNFPAPYEVTHKNHPCTLWAGESEDNWNWLVAHGLALSAEYTKRYNKIHKSELIIRQMKDYGGHSTVKGLTPFAQAMPDEYKCSDAVEAYRKYYIGKKLERATWKYPATKPEWIK